MPKIINESTGHEQTVTNEELIRIQSNPLTSKIFKVIRTKEPVELKKKPKKVKNVIDELVTEEPASEDEQTSV